MSVSKLYVCHHPAGHAAGVPITPMTPLEPVIVDIPSPCPAEDVQDDRFGTMLKF